MKNDPGLHVVKCLHVVCPGASCHPELHAAQKFALPTVDTAPAGHAVHARFTDAVPLVDTNEPAEQLVQYAHAARPALDVYVEPVHAPHTVFTSPSHPLTNPLPTAQLLHVAHVRSAVVLPRNPK